MANFLLTWGTAGSGNNGPQSIQYREYGTSTWITYSTEAPGVTTKTITGLGDNRVYQFRITNNCLNGLASSSNTLEKFLPVCPEFTSLTSPDCGSIQFSFPEIGGTFVTKYIIKLFTSTGVTPIAAFTVTPTGVVGAAVTNTFVNLAPSTNYYIQITYEITGSSIYTQNCPRVSVTTSAKPTCDPVSDVTSSVTGSTLTISWTAPIPAPGVGYEIYYRPVGSVSAYTMTTAASGATSKNITVPPNQDYEGYVVAVCSPCCSNGNPLCKVTSAQIAFRTTDCNVVIINSYNNTLAVLDVYIDKTGEGVGEGDITGVDYPIGYNATDCASHTNLVNGKICVVLTGDTTTSGPGYILISINGTEVDCLDIPPNDYTGTFYEICTNLGQTAAPEDIITVLIENGDCATHV